MKGAPQTQAEIEAEAIGTIIETAADAGLRDIGMTEAEAARLSGELGDLLFNRPKLLRAFVVRETGDDGKTRAVVSDQPDERRESLMVLPVQKWRTFAKRALRDARRQEATAGRR